MNQSKNQSAPNLESNSGDRADALDSLRIKMRQLIGVNTVTVQEVNEINNEINQEVNQEAEPETEEAATEKPEWVSFRCTPEQKFLLKSSCDERGISVSDWVKARVFDQPLPQPRQVKLPYATLQNAIAVNRVNGNLNQLMRRLNRGEFVEDQVLIQCVLETQQVIQKVLVELSAVEKTVEKDDWKTDAK